jgi:peptidoglycan/LPS O-acetylase OafA/YrhL
MLGALGGILLLVGVIWMVVVAIQTGQSGGEKAIWGLVTFFCSPLGSIVFYVMKKQGLVPLLLQIVGFIISIVGGGFNFSVGNLPN